MIGCVTFGQPLACAFQISTWFIVLLSLRGFVTCSLFGKFLHVVEKVVAISPFLYAPNLEGCEGPLATRRSIVRLWAREYDKNRHFQDLWATRLFWEELVVEEIEKSLVSNAKFVEGLRGEINYRPRRLIHS